MGIRPAIENMMRKERIGVAAHIFLTGLSLVYCAGVRLRYLLYGAGVLRRKTLGCRVISIGNITVGGTGKTPVAIFLASLLKKSGHRPAVLSRGYKKTGPGGIVSDGRSIRLGPREAGDEPYLMALRLAGVPVIAGADRVRSGRAAIEEFKADCLILDDGFQHIRLRRDINILLIDPAQGFGNGRMVPRGILREPVKAMRRADFIMLKGPRGRELEGPGAELVKKWKIPVIRFDYRVTGLYDIFDNTDKGMESLKGRKVLAFAGIADPASFFRTLEGLGATLTNTLSFADHHEYTAADIEKIRKAKGGGGGLTGAAAADIIVTTEKDGVKLRESLKGGPQIFALGVEVVVEDEERLKRLLAPVLGARDGGAA